MVARCRLFAYGLADVSVIPEAIIFCLRMVVPICCWLIQVVLAKRPLDRCFIQGCSFPSAPTSNFPLPSSRLRSRSPFLAFPLPLLALLSRRSSPPLKGGPLNPARERCKLLQWGLGQSSSRNRIWFILTLA